VWSFKTLSSPPSARLCVWRFDHLTEAWHQQSGIFLLVRGTDEWIGGRNRVKKNCVLHFDNAHTQETYIAHRYTTGVCGPYHLSEGRPDLDVLVLGPRFMWGLDLGLRQD